MIEVEKKYRLDEDQKNILTEGATLLGSKTNKDTYFDTEAFSLTTQDYWLRNRNGQFELKLRLHELGHGLGGTSYEEITDTKRIAGILGISDTVPFEQALAEGGFTPFVTLTKHRESYEREGFHIDLDTCTFGYQVAEIELEIEDESKRDEAMNRIDAFADRIGLDTTPVRGKIIEYLFRFNKTHYQALVDAGVI